MASSAGLKNKSARAHIKRTPVRAAITPVLTPVETRSTELALVNESKPEQVENDPQQNASTRRHAPQRYETRLTRDDQAVLDELHERAVKQVHKSNKGLYKPELFGALIEFIRPFHQRVSFRNIDFKRGRLYGEGTHLIKKEAGRSLQVAAARHLLEHLKLGASPEIATAVSQLSSEDRLEIARILQQWGPHD